MEAQIRIADRTGRLTGEVDPVQECALRLLMEIELYERNEAAVLTMRTNRVLATLAGTDFATSFAGTGMNLPTSETPMTEAVTDSEIDEALGRDGEPNGPALYRTQEESISEADFFAMLAELQTQRFTAAEVESDDVWGKPV